MQIKPIKFRMVFLYSWIFSIAAIFTPGLRADGTHAEKLNKFGVLELLNQATQFFNEANSESLSREDAVSLYQKAALRYERLINRYGITNGELYYNIGNTYFMMGDTGRAILNYLRAERYIPDDRNLKQNLRYAREIRIDKIEEKQESKVLRPLFPRRYNLSVKARVMFFSFFFALAWVTAAFRIFFKRPFLSWCLTVSVFVSVLIAGSFVADELALKRNRVGVVTSSETAARKGNSETYEPSFANPIHAGTEFILLGDRDGWLYIKLADSRTCWISARDAALL